MFDALVGHPVGEHGPSLVGRGLVEDSLNGLNSVKFYAVASATILYYDYLATLPEEMRRIWTARFSGATLLFLLNRYIPVFGYIPVLYALFDPPWTITKFAPFIGAMTTLGQVVLVVILVLRTYALYQRNIWVLIFTLSVGLTSIGISTWAAVVMTGELFSFHPFGLCAPTTGVHEDQLKFSWTAIFAFDYVIFMLTICRTILLRRAQRNAGTRSSLATLIMRDGIVLCAVNIGNFVYFAKAPGGVFLFQQTTGSNSMLTHIVSSTMMSRLLLNLRQESKKRDRHQTSHAATTLTDTNLIFTTRIMGNLTADLRGDDSDSSYGYTSSGERTRDGTIYSSEFGSTDGFDLPSTARSTVYSHSTALTTPIEESCVDDGQEYPGTSFEMTRLNHDRDRPTSAMTV
ncbi:hypothetical protein BD410DRAFT_794241 [Rickenella mellea]|uniref:DUF6533 domain-containing protein n=1 Tax=Rickenella mellea TaxID=50990 RepID=A0A4Y7PQV7_9AGAM|nr:hypothetical protein BD410DRAFT_794241 [Rickenella mellea]